MRARENLIGAWAMFIGVILAITVGVIAGDKSNPLIYGILALLGIVVGYFVAEKDIQTFLMASVSLVAVSYFGISGSVVNSAVLGVQVGRGATSALIALIVMFVPATIIVALKSVFSISKS